MTITFKSLNLYEGLSTDTKPTTNVLAGTRFRTTDTGIIYVFDGASTWYEEVSTSQTQTLTFKNIDALTNSVKNIGLPSYEMWKLSTTYYAREIATGTVTSNSNFRTLFNTVTAAIAIGAGTIGGTIHLRKGTYDVDTEINISNSTYETNRVRIIGEGIDLTTIKYTGTAGIMFKPFCNFEFENLTLDGNALATQLISCGQPVRGRCTNIKFARHTDIGLWYGLLLKSFITDKCIFEDPRGTQDQHAYTCTEYGIVRGCTFDRLDTVFTSAVPGGSCLTSGGGDNILIEHNRFTKKVGQEQNGFGCSIEPWDRSYNNVVISNNVFQAAILRVGGGVIADWDNAGTPTCLMRNIVINGNVCNGAEIGVMGPTTSFSDKVREVTITNNIIYKSNNAGIRLNFLSGPVIANGNMIVDSNMAGAVNTLGDHGCVWIYETTDVTFNDNKIYMTATGTNVNPYGLRISVVDGIIAQGNTFVNTTGNPSYQDAGSSLNKYVKDNFGIVDDISHVRQRDLGSSFFRMHGNDGNTLTFVNAEGTGPNQDFHFFPDYNKQGGATSVIFYYGYNADFSSVKFLSKWSGLKEYVNFDYANNLIDLKTPVRIGDNLRLKLNETGLTAEREFTFPDKAGKVLTDSSPVVQSPIIKRTGAYQPITPTSGTTAAVVGRLEGILANHVPTGPGTNTNTWDTTEGLLINLITTTTINQNAGLLSPTGAVAMLRRERAAKMSYRGKIDTVAAGVARLYFGVSSNATLNISDTIANGDSLVLVGFKAADASYSIYYNDGSGAHATTVITGTIAKNTNFHTIEIEWTAGGNVVVTFDGTSQTISTDLPATTTNLFFHCLAQNASAAIRTHSIVGVWVESE